jgi:hypothetical protein
MLADCAAPASATARWLSAGNTRPQHPAAKPTFLKAAPNELQMFEAGSRKGEATGPADNADATTITRAGAPHELDMHRGTSHHGNKAASIYLSTPLLEPSSLVPKAKSVLKPTVTVGGGAAHGAGDSQAGQSAPKRARRQRW